MSPLNITQPLGIWSINVYNGYYKVMSNIPKMGHLPTPVIFPQSHSCCSTCLQDQTARKPLWIFTTPGLEVPGLLRSDVLRAYSWNMLKINLFGTLLVFQVFGYTQGIPITWC